MEQQEILGCINNIKSILTPVPDTLLGRAPVIACLDPISKNKYMVLQEFLPQLEKMKKSVINEINTITPLSKQWKAELESLYNKREAVNKTIACIENEINDLKWRISSNTVDMTTYCGNIDGEENAINTCREDIKRAKERWAMVLIPVVGLFYIEESKRIREVEIPKLETNIAYREWQKQRYQDCYNELMMHNQNYDNQVIDLQCKIAPCRSELNSLEVSIGNIHKKIVLQVNNLTYLSILKQRMETFILHGGTSTKIMEMLDKDPEQIHYDDDTYFKLLDTWQENHDEKVFEDFIMKVEKEFFT